MLRELRTKGRPEQAHAAGSTPPKTPRQAVLQIIAADVSMSLDTVLAGAARDHEVVLWIWLGLSVVLMAVAANYIAVSSTGVIGLPGSALPSSSISPPT